MKEFYKKSENNKVWWVENSEQIGAIEFSFNRKKIYNLFRDYPYKLSEKEIKIFDAENPYWANFVRDRKKS